MSFVSRLRMANMFPINSDLGTATVDDSGDEMNDVINAGKALFQYNRMFQNDRPLGMQRVAQSAAPSGVIGNPNMPADPRVTELSPQLRFGGVIGGQNDPGAQMNAQAGQDVRKIYDSYNQPAITAGEILGKAGIKQNDQDPGMTAAIKDLDPDQELNREVKRQTIRNGQATVESKGWHTVNVTDPNDATKTIAVQVQDGTGAVKPVDIPGTITSKASPAALEKMASERASLAESQENIRTQATDALALLDQLLDPKTNELTNEAQWATGGSAILGKIPLPTAAYAGASKLDRLAKIQVLSLIEEMKKQSASGSVGMGNMSNSDRAVLENASSLLGRPGLDEDTIKQELIKVKGILQKAQRGGAPPLATSHGQPNATLEPGKIRVRNRITGETGTMSQGAFNPSKYERIQ